GWRPGIISRGYGIDVGPKPRLSDDGAAADRLGDEPALIHASTGAPVAVHPRRVLAATALLSAHPDTDVLIADDGLQHTALARDLEIIVQDGRGIGNGRLLPAGPLREPPGRLAKADWLVTHLAAGEPMPSGPATSLPGTDPAPRRPGPRPPRRGHAPAAGERRAAGPRPRAALGRLAVRARFDTLCRCSRHRPPRALLRHAARRRHHPVAHRAGSRPPGDPRGHAAEPARRPDPDHAQGRREMRSPARPPPVGGTGGPGLFRPMLAGRCGPGTAGHRP